jgi:hypothetical protein
VPAGILYRSRTRTFFHASLRDNPILETTGYGATIDALPEPLRSLLKGNFGAARIADPWQVIPSAWVRAAQARWVPHVAQQSEDGDPFSVEYGGAALRSTGLDVAWGGKDKTVIARLYGSWIAPLLKYPGASTPDGPTVAALALPYTDAEYGVALDVIGGGLSSRDSLVGMDVKVNAINFGAAAPMDARDRVGEAEVSQRARACLLAACARRLDPEHRR